MPKKPKSKEESEEKEEEIVQILKLESDLEEEIEEAEEEKKLQELSEFILPVPGNVSTTSLDQDELVESGGGLQATPRDEEEKKDKPIVYGEESSEGLYNALNEVEYIESGRSEPEAIASSRKSFTTSYEVEQVGEIIPVQRGHVSRIVHRQDMERPRDNLMPSLDQNYVTSSEIEHRESRDSIFKSQERKYKITK